MIKKTEIDMLTKPAGDAHTVYDISDLLQYWQENIRPTGIQRVQVEVIRSLLHNNNKTNDSVTYVFFCIRQQEWKHLDNVKLSEQIILSDERKIDENTWRLARRDMVENAPTMDFNDRCILVNIGSSWWIPDYLHKIKCLKQEFGLRYVPFIHDTIPLTTPQYCSQELVLDFVLWFRDAIRIADHIIVNSESSKKDVYRFAMLSNRASPDISVCTLNARFHQSSSNRRSRAAVELGVYGRNFVLCVSTLEIRKNHLLLFKVWSELLDQLPEEEVPLLVLVGKAGWKFDMAQAYLKDNQTLEKKVVIASNISDFDLSYLYEKCMFTVYPSFYEGWGLPVSEAASYGKLTICSNTSSLPEAASQGDVLLDPLNEKVWFEQIKLFVTDPNELDRAQNASSSKARFRTWSEIAKCIDIHAKVSLVENEVSYPIANVVDGVIYDFSASTARNNYNCSAMALRAGSGWHHLEEWGAWSAPGEAEMVFETADLVRRFVYLVIRGGRQDKNLRISYNHRIVLKKALKADCDVIIRLDLDGAGSRKHTLTLSTDVMCDLGHLTDGKDSRQVGFGMLKFSCMKADDLFSRQNFIESLQMHFVHFRQ